MTFESKFRNVVGRIEKLSKEETTILLRNLLEELNNEKLIKEKPKYIQNDSEDWKEVNKEIERSNIKRYKWKQILGETLTKVILQIRKDNFDAEETIRFISNSNEVKDFLEKYPSEKENMMKNIKINVYARYGENKTAEELKDSSFKN